MTDKTRGILHVLGVASCLLAVSVTAAGCGGDGNDLAQFTGTWQYTDSSVTFSCPGQADQTGLYGAFKIWNEGVTSDLVDMTPTFLDGATQCFYTFDVKGKVATIKPMQICSFLDASGQPIVDDNGQPIVDAPSAWTFTLTSATAAEEKFTSSFESPCTLVGMATLKKIAASN
jgi:hypothetical protein